MVVNTCLNGHCAGRFRVYIQSLGQGFEFFTLVGARQFLQNQKEEGINIDYYSIFDKDTGEYVESQSGRTE